MYHVLIEPPVCEALGRFFTDREIKLRIYNRLYSRLESLTSTHQMPRDPEDPDFFEYTHSLYVRNEWHTLKFTINDRMAPGFLHVVAVSRQRTGG